MGAVRATIAPRNAFHHLIPFTGRPGEVTTGLQNNLNRWYDASVGSWINEDPIGFEGGDTNLYRYCGNDPVNAADPNGLVTRRSDLMREFGLGSSYGSGLRRDLDNLDTAVAAGTAFTKKFIGDFYVGMGLAAGTTIEGGLETLGAFLEEPLGMTYLTIENAVLAVWNYDETAKKMATGVCDVIKVMGSDNNVAKSQIANQVLFGAMIPGAGKTVMDDLFKGWKQSRAELAAASKAGNPSGLPKGVLYDGAVHRAVPAKYADGAWDIHAGNIGASHRYSGPGRGALYTGASREAVLAELRHYGVDPDSVAWVSRNVSIDNVLDLTNANVRTQLGISLEQLTSNDYFITQALGDFARGRYSALLVPSARLPGASNLVILP